MRTGKGVHHRPAGGAEAYAWIRAGEWQGGIMEM